MATARVFKTKEEFADEISRLRPLQMARLRQASVFLARISGTEADDLLQEAVTRGIEGRRRWPDHIDILTFLFMVMKSLGDGELKKAARRPEIDPDDEGDPDIYADVSPEGLGRRSDEILISEEQRQALLNLFADDAEAQLIVDGMLGGMEGEELREFVDLDATAYASKRRKIRRAINRHYRARKSLK